MDDDLKAILQLFCFSLIGSFFAVLALTWSGVADPQGLDDFALIVLFAAMQITGFTLIYDGVLQRLIGKMTSGV